MINDHLEFVFLKSTILICKANVLEILKVLYDLRKMINLKVQND